MATVDDPGIVREILLNDGVYPDDPQLYSVWEYENTFGNQTHSLCMNLAAEISLINSLCVAWPVLLWNRHGLTKEGSAWLLAHQISERMT